MPILNSTLHVLKKRINVIPTFPNIAAQSFLFWRLETVLGNQLDSERRAVGNIRYLWFHHFLLHITNYGRLVFQSITTFFLHHMAYHVV